MSKWNRNKWMLLSWVLLAGCTEQEAPRELVDTSSRPTHKQWKGQWAFMDSTVFFSNEFEGARLNGLIMDSAHAFTALIAAENYPINPSPWYAFKVWSKTPLDIKIKLTYGHSYNRYYPKISEDGIHFTPVDSANVLHFSQREWGMDTTARPLEISLHVDETPRWIAAQELWPSARVNSWSDSLVTVAGGTPSVIGTSREERPLRMMEMGSKEAKKAILIISRQHPPEVTGFLAMKSFVETLGQDSKRSNEFRSAFKVFCVPLMNPDGVDHGHWRHNLGGIDLNRDWQSFNQPETSAVRDFILAQEAMGTEFVFAADFHSTYQDIYYPLDSALTDKKAHFIYDWIKDLSADLDLPLDSVNIAPSQHLIPTMVSRNYFYKAHGIPAIVFELGDNTARDFLAKKGEVAALRLMDILLAQHEASLLPLP